jgi:mycothiol synthase
MNIRPYQGEDESDILAVWRNSMTVDRISEDVFRTRVLLDPNFSAENLPVAVEGGTLSGLHCV